MLKNLYVGGNIINTSNTHVQYVDRLKVLDEHLWVLFYGSYTVEGYTVSDKPLWNPLKFMTGFLIAYFNISNDWTKPSVHLDGLGGH